MKRIAVVGYYNQGNIGDEAFKRAIPNVLGRLDYEYVFQGSIPHDINDSYTHLVIGGGSFLDEPIPGVENKVVIPTGFLGVGDHGVYHDKNLELLNRAEIIVQRNLSRKPSLLTGMWSPDLVMNLAVDLRGRYLFHRLKKNNPAMYQWQAGVPETAKILVVLNGFLLPRKNDEGYKVEGYKKFQKFLKDLEKDFPNVRYVAMQTKAIDDRWMRPDLKLPEASEEAFCKAVLESDVVFTTRFHGCVYSNIFGVPFVGLSAHDKMKSFFVDRMWDNFVDYYNISLESVLRAAKECPAEDYIYEMGTMENRIWHDLIPVVREQLRL